MKTILYQIQGLLLLALAVFFFFYAPNLIRLTDPTAGALDPGVLTRVTCGAAFFFFATFCAWVAMLVDWPDVQRWMDRDTPNGSFKSAWDEYPSNKKLVFSAVLFFSLTILFVVCVSLVPAA